MPITWVKSAVIRNGRPTCHECNGKLLSTVTMVDSIGRPIKGLYIPSGTKAVVSWPKNMLDKLPEADQMYVYVDKITPINTTGYNDGNTFIEIDDVAASYDRSRLMKWLSGQYTEKGKDVPQQRPLKMGQTWKPGESSFKI